MFTGFIGFPCPGLITGRFGLGHGVASFDSPNRFRIRGVRSRAPAEF
jgi:hypothetical protein